MRLPSSSPLDRLVRPGAAGAADAPLPSDASKVAQKMVHDGLEQMAFMQSYSYSGPRAPNSAQQFGAAGPTGTAVYDGATLALIGEARDTASAFSVIGCLAPGWTSLHADYFVPGPNDGHIGLEGFVAGYPSGQAWAGFNVAIFDPTRNLGLRAGPQGTIITNGSSKGGDPAKSDDKPLRSHVHRREMGWGMAAFFGAAITDWLMGLVRIDWSQNKRRVLETTLGADVSAYLSEANDTWVSRWIKNSWRALTGFDTLRLPPITKPEQLRVGESLTHTYDRARSGFMSFGLYLFAGHQCSVGERSEVKVTRTDKGYNVEVLQQHMPLQRFFGLVPGGFSLNRAASRPKWTQKVFEQADLPTCQKLLKQLDKNPHEPLVEQATSGYTGTARVAAREGGVRFLLFLSELWERLLPRGFSFGLLKQCVKLEGEHRAQDSEVTHRFYVNDAQRMLGPRGHLDHRVTATVHDGAEAPAPVLTLSLSIEASRCISTDLNQWVIAPLRQHFAAPLAEFQSANPTSGSRSVGLARQFDAGEMEFLRKRLADGVPAQELTGELDAEALQTLGASARRAADPTKFAQFAEDVATFVQDHGVTGMALMHRLASVDAADSTASLSRLILSTDSDVYTQLHTTVNDLELRFSSAPHPGDGVASLRERFREVRDALAALQSSRQLMKYEDPLLSPAFKAAAKTERQGLKARLHALLSVDDAAVKRQLCRMVRQKTWHSTIDAEILDYYDTGVRAARHATDLAQAGLEPAEYAAQATRLHEELHAAEGRLRSELVGRTQRQERRSQIARATEGLDQPTAEFNPVAAANVERRLLKQRRDAGSTQRRRELQAARGKATRQATDLLRVIDTATHVTSRQWKRAASNLRQPLAREKDFPEYAAAQAALAGVGRATVLAQTRQEDAKKKVREELDQLNNRQG